MKAKPNPSDAMRILLSSPRSVTTGELADHLIAQMGGISEFARTYIAEVNTSKTGTVTKARLLDGILRLVTNASAQNKNKTDDDGSGLSDDELHAEASRLLDRTGPANAAEKGQSAAPPPPPAVTALDLLADAQAAGLFIPPDAPGGPGVPLVPPTPPEGPGPLSDVERCRAKRLLAEIANRRREGLRLYEPLPIMQAFHLDMRKERLLRGGNRSGKTLGAAVELARAVTGQDPLSRYPKKDGRAALVGIKGEHLADVMYRKLCRPNAFRIVRDLDSGEWRAFRPHAEPQREKETRPAPPLIPKRFIQSIAWEEKKTNTPRRIITTTGWEMTFYSSAATPPNGIDIDYLWIDEEITNESWWPEMVARLLDRHGIAIWSACPQVQTEHLFNLHQCATDCPDEVGEHVVLLEDNPHIDVKEKKLLESRLVTEEERATRLRGEFAMTGWRIYPRFSMNIHGKDLEGTPPADWCRFLIVDPGRQVCACLFAAVPPPSYAHEILLYDELYLKGCDADMFGREVAAKSDHVIYEAFVIDGHAGRITEMGSGLSVEEQYSRALRKYNVSCVRTGSQFTWASDDVKAGILAVQEALRIRNDGLPTVRVARGRLPNFEWEIVRYHNRKVKKIVTDEPEKKNDHLMDCLRYLCGFNPTWHTPRVRKAPQNYAVKFILDKLARRTARRAGDGSGPHAAIRMGPGSSGR